MNIKNLSGIIIASTQPKKIILKRWLNNTNKDYVQTLNKNINKNKVDYYS